MKYSCDTCEHRLDCFNEDRIIQTGYPGHEHFIVGFCRWCPLKLSASGDFEEGRKMESYLLDHINEQPIT